MASSSVDGEFIRAANDRLQWDGIWEDTVIRLRRGSRSVHAALDEAFVTLFKKTGSKPQLILCSWAAGRELLLEAYKAMPHGHFPTNADYEREASKRPFQQHSGTDEMFERGYLGTYAGAVVIASVHLGVWGSNYAIISSVLAPREVQYDGSNCVMVDLEGVR